MSARKKKRAAPAKSNKAAAPAPVPVHRVMTDFICGYWASQMIHVVTKLGIPDALGKNALTAESLAKSVGADPVSLYRVLRALATLQILTEDRQRRFRLTPLGQTLRADQKGSLRDLALVMMDDWNWETWGALLHGVKTGGQVFAHLKGMPLFDYLHKHPEQERVFAGSMSAVSASENGAIANAYPFHELTRLVDVGGAHGPLLATVLAKAKKLKGILYDQAQVVAGAARSGFITAPVVAKRIETVGGSFFESVPTGADGYMMKYVMHDWDDEACVRILRNCRDAMAKNGRVLVIDHVLKQAAGPDPGSLLDVWIMLITPGGKERTKDEFLTLLQRAGLKLRRIVPTHSTLSILEAVRA